MQFFHIFSMGFAWEQKFGGQYTGERASWCGGHRSLQLLGMRTSDFARVLMDSGREFALEYNAFLDALE